MSVKCNVQERPEVMKGRVLNVCGKDDDYRLIVVELADIDGSLLEGSLIVPPDVAVPKPTTDTFDMEVILEAHSHPFGDVAVCVSQVKLGNEFHELRARG